jgi:hypothetical protein
MPGISRTQKGVTLRAVLIGLAFIPANAYLVVQLETVWGLGDPTTMTIFFNAVFCLFLLIALNLPFRRFLPRTSLHQGELLTIYCMLVVAISVSGQDFTHTIFGTLGNARWFATPENEWAELFLHHLPEWIEPSTEALEGYFSGESSFYTAKHVRGWLRPILWWTAFLTALCFVMICITTVVRKQWIERERLTFPLTYLPAEMTEAGFLRNRLLWIGFGLAAGINLINGLNALLPSFPRIPLSYDLSVHFVERPWSAIRNWPGVPIQANPFIIGLTFVIPLGLLFSCWFFYLVWKLQYVLGSALGVHIPRYPFADQQVLGGYLGVVVVALWLARRHFWFAFRAAAGGRSQAGDSTEPMSYRAAVWGAVLGGVFVIGFCYSAGMSAVFAAAFFGIYFLILFGFTRMRAELGPLMHGVHFFGPFQLIVAGAGSRVISPRTLIVTAPYWTHTKEFLNKPMPAYLEGFKLADRAGVDTRRLWKVCLLASFLSIGVTFWAFLDLSYKWGAPGAWRGNLAYTAIARLLRHPTDPDGMQLGATAFGVVFVLVGTVLRLRYVWWPFYPLAYPLAGYYYFNYLWFPFFACWLIKGAILRYGGIRAYRQALPLFLGLVLGDFVPGTMWAVLGLLTGARTYMFQELV